MGGIVAEGTSVQSSLSKNRQLQVNVRYLIVLPIQLNLPGPAIEQITATDIQAGGANGHQMLQVTLNNTGTQMVQGNGSLQVANTQGVILQNLPFTLDTFLPDTSIDYQIYVQKKALGPGDYQGTLDLTYGHSHVLHYVTKFTITQAQVNQAFSNSPLQAPTGNAMPLWQIILVTLAAAIVLLLGGQKLYGLVSARRRKQTNKPTPPTDGSNQSMDTSKKREKVTK